MRSPADLRRRTLRDLLFLAGLRPQISTILKKELAMMPTVFDELNLSENVFFQDLYKAAIAEGIAEGTEKGKAEGIEQGIEKGIEQGIEKGQRQLLHRLLTRKFAPLPQWATDRLNTASAAELELWSERLLSAASLEETLNESLPVHREFTPMRQGSGY
jgi:predicted transposase YdaD